MLFDSHRLKPDRHSAHALRRLWIMSCVSLALSGAILASILGAMVMSPSLILFWQLGAAESNARMLHSQEANARPLREGESSREGVQFGAASVQTGVVFSSYPPSFTTDLICYLVQSEPHNFSLVNRLCPAWRFLICWHGAALCAQ